MSGYSSLADETEGEGLDETSSDAIALGRTTALAAMLTAATSPSFFIRVTSCLDNEYISEAIPK